jgi:adenylate cyclase
VFPSWGIEVHAAVVDNLLRQVFFGVPPVRFWTTGASLAWTMGWALAAGALILLPRRPWHWIVAVVAGNAILLGAPFAAFAFRWVWMPVVPPLLTWNVTCLGLVLYELHLERKARQAVRRVIRRTVPEPIYALLWGQRRRLEREGAIDSWSGTATVLFSDLEGFSDVSRLLRGRENDMIRWLNEYLHEMSVIIQSREFGGLVVSYMGDGIMAVFGPPDFTEPDAWASAAVGCAVKMRARLAELRQRWAVAEARGLRMRIGIYTGKVIDGVLGGAGRLDYCVIGDTVNTAARLESWNKREMSDGVAVAGCRIVIGDSTLKLVGDSFKTRDLGEVDLPGPGRVHIHAVIG